MGNTEAHIAANRVLAQSILQALLHPVFLVDKQARCHLENEAAKRFRDKTRILRLSYGKITSYDNSQNAELAMLIGELGRERTGVVLGPHKIWSPEQDSLVLVFLAPLDAGGSLGWPACGLLMIHEVENHGSADRQALQRVFGLSEAEARIASLLTEGHTVASVAEALAISIGTVRTHLKSIFRKTGARRQQDLMRIASRASIAPTLREQ